MPLDVLTLGETLIALDAAEPGRIESVRMLRKTVAGAESNTAIGLARLGCRVAWVSRVARDPFGEEVLKVLRGEGVDVGAVVRVDGAPTGLMIKERRTATEVHVHYWRSGSAAAGLGPEDVDERLVAEARRVHLTGITLSLGERPRAAVHKVLRCCAERGIPVSFDPNLRRKLRPVADAAVVAVDAVGSGDAFNAGYLFGQLRELGFRESVALGNWVAARVTGHPGDYEGLPTLAEYQAHRDGTGTVTR